MTVRVAAGDIHCSEEERARLETAFMDAERESDLILLAGDLTTYGEPEQAAVLADVARGSASRSTRCWGTTTGTRTGTRSSCRCCAVAASTSSSGRRRWSRWVVDVGIVGTKGFIGGFTGSLLPDFEGSRSSAASTPRARRSRLRPRPAPGLRLRRPHRPSPLRADEDDDRGEPETIWAYLGSERLAEPIAEHSQTSSCTATATAAHSPARSTTFRSSTSASRHRPRLLDLRVRREWWCRRQGGRVDR